MLWELSTRYGKVIAGTSANPSGKKAYSVFDQEQALEELRFKVDGFVKIDNLSESPSPSVHLTSSTIIDMTGPQPVVKRGRSTSRQV